MTDKIILELTLDELKLIDKYVELNDETESVFDKIKDAYPQPKMTFQQEGDYVVVSYNDMTYYRLIGETTFAWYFKMGASVSQPLPTLTMINDAETERLLDGLYYNDVVVKKEKEMIRQNLKTSLEELANGDVRPIDDVIEEAKEEQTKTPCEIAYKDWRGMYPGTGTWDSFDATRWIGFEAGYNAAYEEKVSEWKPTPQTPEQVADGLKEAFREAVKQGVVSSSTKPQTLSDLIYDWWERVFGDTDDTETCIDNLVDEISLWLPKEHDTNSYKWNECIRMIKSKLR